MTNLNAFSAYLLPDFFCKERGGIVPFKQFILSDVRTHKPDWNALNKLPVEHAPYYTYFINKYVSTLDRKSQVVYYHYLSGVPIATTCILLHIDEIKALRILNFIYEEKRSALAYLDEFQDKHFYDGFPEDCEEYYDALTDELVTDEEIAHEYDQELSSVKIARMFTEKFLEIKKQQA